MKGKGSTFALMGMVLTLTLSITFGAKALRIFSGLSQQENKIEELRAVVSSTAIASGEMETVGLEDNRSGYQKLFEKNQDFFGWISIPDTKVDYPIMYTPTQPNYYLNRDFDGGYSDYGLPYMDEKSEPLTTGAYRVIYGHNMKNGEMFQALTKYTDQAFYKHHSQIYLDQVEKQEVYDIVYVFLASSAENSFAYEQYVGVLSEEEKLTFIETCTTLSLYDTKIQVTPNDQLLILSTCFYKGDQDRFVVVGRLAEKN